MEYALQLDGIAAALELPELRDAILAFPEAPVALAVFEWSASSYQRDILGWTELSGPGDLVSVIAHLRGWQREAAPEFDRAWRGPAACRSEARHRSRLLAAGHRCLGRWSEQ